MNAVLDRARIESVVQRYDFWLDFDGVRRPRRRELRSELRANLRDAATHQGVQAALLGIGSPRGFARDTANADGARPSWSVGAYLGLAVFSVLTLLWLVTMLGFVDGVQASGVTGREVSGTVFPWGSPVSAEIERDGSGLQAGGTLPLAIWLLSLAAFVAGARPWHLFGSRKARLTPG
ncbi:MAG: hypothetical protein ABIN79_09205 [Marmoricola sp.]